MSPEINEYQENQELCRRKSMSKNNKMTGWNRLMGYQPSNRHNSSPTSIQI